MLKMCKVEGCGLAHYAKGYCRKHYSAFSRNGSQIYTTPKLLGLSCEICGKSGRHKYDDHILCNHHKKMLDKYGSIIFTDPAYHLRGKNNPRWNGGVSNYPNHAEFKRNRLIKLSQVNYTCEECGDYTNKCHHKDISRTNHAVDNLKALCSKCHIDAHRQKRSHMTMKVNTSKYIREYGATIQVLAKRLRVCKHTVIAYHRQGKLASMLNA